MNPDEMYQKVGEWNEDIMHVGQIWYHGGPLRCVLGQFKDGVLEGYVTEINKKGEV